jgi:predicted RNA-binding protein
MCLSKAFIKNEEGNGALLENVVSLEAKDEKIVLSNILGEKQEIDGEIKSINFSKGEIYLERK